MKHPISTAKKAKLSSSTTNHILWGIVCLGLVLFAMAMWQNIQALQRQNAELHTDIATLKARDAQCTARDTWAAGTTKQFTILTKDGLRQYDVHLPATFQPDVYYPLVINYPGKGATALGGAEQSRLATLPAVSVYPSPTIGQDGYTAWQGAPYSSPADDIAFTSEILDKVQSQLCIDRDRVYATGMSNGGGMVSLLSCRMPDRFAAFGIVAGAMYAPTADCTPPRPTPLITVHGDSDPNVPYQGSSLRRLPAVTQWVAERAKDNGCQSQPTTTSLDATTTVMTWKQCDDNASVEAITFHGGGHFWPPQTTDLLWQFMSRHRLQ